LQLIPNYTKKPFQNIKSLLKPLKIAIYSGSVPSATFIERLIQGLAEKGLHVYLFGFQNKKITRLTNVYYITYTDKLSKLMIFIKYTLLLILFQGKDKKKLDGIIRSKNKSNYKLKLKYYPVLYHSPDIFHLQWAKGISDWIWVQEFGIKLIVSLRGAHINYSPIADEELANTYKKLFPKVDGFHAVSESIAKESMNYNALEKKIKVIYSGLDLNQISFNNKLFDTKSPLNIISIGRDHWKKGYSYALDAMNLLDKDHIDFNYTIVGVGENEELLYKRSQFDCKNKIIFKEKLPFIKVKELIKNADVLLLSSVEEGIANVVLEAMAIGTLVVSTDCGGMHEVIKNNENGFLVPIRNSETIATTIKKLTELPVEKYLSLTQNARKTVEDHHNHNCMIEEMKDLYQLVSKEGL